MAVKGIDYDLLVEVGIDGRGLAGAGIVVLGFYGVFVSEFTFSIKSYFYSLGLVLLSLRTT